MKAIKLSLGMAIAAHIVLIAGCATPHVVEVAKTGDSAMSCSQLDLEMVEADRFKATAKGEKGMTGTNVAAAIFFFPAIFATYSNSNEAIAASDARRAHLSRIYDEKKCQEVAKDDKAKQTEKETALVKLEQLKSALGKGLITKEEYAEKRVKILKDL